MEKQVAIIGAGLAGSEAALTLADAGVRVELYEMRPIVKTPVHHSDNCAELVCSNSLKSTRPDSAAGMLKAELTVLGSHVLEAAHDSAVPAGGALAVDRERFSNIITRRIEENQLITLHREEVRDLPSVAEGMDALMIATGPLTSDALSQWLLESTGTEALAFYDAAAPIVMADSLNYDILFRQSRYEEGEGDYLNAPFTQEEYETFISELLDAQRVIQKDFETKDLFQACQPIEEIARKGVDAPRFGTMKPVGLTDPRTGKRPWAALQLRAEDAGNLSYNLVGFQTNLTFPEQQRVFRMIPGLEQAEFARYGVMHRNTFLNAPTLLDATGSAPILSEACGVSVYVAGQLAGTEGYAEAIRSGQHGAFSILARLQGIDAPALPQACVFGALLAYATSPNTVDYQPMHVNFGIIEPLSSHVKNKRQRYDAYARRGAEALQNYASNLVAEGLLNEEKFKKGMRDAAVYLPD